MKDIIQKKLIFSFSSFLLLLLFNITYVSAAKKTVIYTFETNELSNFEPATLITKYPSFYPEKNIPFDPLIIDGKPYDEQIGARFEFLLKPGEHTIKLPIYHWGWSLGEGTYGSQMLRERMIIEGYDRVEYKFDAKEGNKYSLQCDTPAFISNRPNSKTHYYPASYWLIIDSNTKERVGCCDFEKDYYSVETLYYTGKKPNRIIQTEPPLPTGFIKTNYRYSIYEVTGTLHNGENVQIEIDDLTRLTLPIGKYDIQVGYNCATGYVTINKKFAHINLIVEENHQYEIDAFQDTGFGASFLVKDVTKIK